MNDDFEKPHRIDDLEKRLYSPNPEGVQKKRRPLRPQEYDVPKDWKSEHVVLEETPLNSESNIPRANWFFRIFILAFIFFVAALGYVGFKFYLNDGVSAQDVDILVNAPLTVGAGEIMDFEIQFQNRNQMPIKYVDIEVVFPDGTRSSEDIGSSYKNDKETVEAIEIGEIVKRNYDALLFGEENEKKEIAIFLKYQVNESTILYQKEKKFDVILKSTPIRLSISNVKQITSGQELDFTIELVSNSTQVLKDIIVQASYPFGFLYKSSSIAPQDDKKTWIIPSLAPKETLTFNVKGIIEGQNSDEKFFDFVVGLKDEVEDSPQVVFSKKGTIVNIERPFIEVDFAIDGNNSDTLTLDPGKSQTATVSFKNNTDSQLRNVSIVLDIKGDVVLEDSIRASEGFYQSLDDKITWDYTTSNDLVSIPVGSSGTVSFNFAGKGLSSEDFLLNPETTFTINMKGNRNPDNKVSELLEDSIIKLLKFNTEVALDSYSKYYSGPFTNSGPVPPKVEQKTTYTSVVSLKNTSNAISNGMVTMSIPNYVTYGGVFSPDSESVSYDSYTRILSWNVGNISPKTGFDGNVERTLSLQTSIIPSVSQAGDSPILIQDILFSGTDSFTGQKISKNSKQITTNTADAKDYYEGTVSK